MQAWTPIWKPPTPMNNAPRVNYPLPILATLASTAFVMVLFAVLAFFSAVYTLRQFTEPTADAVGSALTGGACGLIALILLATIGFFLRALVQGLRDLGQPIQRVSGWVAEKTAGRATGGATWIIVQLGDPPPVPAAPDALPEPVFTSALSETPVPRRAGPAVQAAQPTTAGFGAGLAEVQQNTRRVADSPLAPVPAVPIVLDQPRDRTNSRRFRVDKPLFKELQVGDVVTVGCSRFLEHVYYVERQTGDDRVVLYNRSLI
jgi:hypothetical protein